MDFNWFLFESWWPFIIGGCCILALLGAGPIVLAVVLIYIARSRKDKSDT